MTLTFEDLAKANRDRLVAWHGELVDWSVTDWAVAMAGEAGEVCNAVKKLRRIETNTIGAGGPHTREEAIAAIADEVADTLIYLDLLAWKLGFDLAAAVRDKFNRISVREGFPHRLEPRPTVSLSDPIEREALQLAIETIEMEATRHPFKGYPRAAARIRLLLAATAESP